MNHLEEAKLLATLLAVLKKENSDAKNALLKELKKELEEQINENVGTKYLELDEVENPIPIQVFRGEQGKRGPKGAPGKDGRDGIDGVDGRDGVDGKIGPIGLRGPEGPVGPKGDKGDPGKDGVDGQTPDVKPLEDKFQKMFDTFSGTVSAQITRMAYARGGEGGGGSPGSGEVRLLRLDDVDLDTLDQGEGVFGDGKYLRYNANTQMLEFVATFNSTHFRYLTGTILPAQIAANTISISKFINDSDFADTSYVDTAIANLVDSAPDALDTLWELADALNNNPNFGAEVINSLSLKANTSQISTVGYTGSYNDLTDTPSFANLSSSLIPSANVIYDLGTEEMRWRTLYLSGNTIVIGNATITTSDTIVNLPPGSTIGGSSLQSLINDRIQVANVAATYATKSELSNTNTSLVNDINDRLQVANANITYVTKQTALESNNALKALVDDRLQVANANIAFTTKSQSLAANNELLRLINDRMQVANVQSLVDNSINNVLDGAPAALDTLNELAAAIGDDQNFIATINNDLSLKANTSQLTQYLQVSNASSVLSNTSTTSASLSNSVITFTRADSTTYTLDVSSIQGEVSNSYLTSTYVSNTQFQSFVSNTNPRFAKYLQVSNSTSFLTGANNTGGGVTFTSNSIINNTIQYKTLRAGENVSIQTNPANTEIIISAGGGNVSGDFDYGLITSPVDQTLDYGLLN